MKKEKIKQLLTTFVPSFDRRQFIIIAVFLLLNVIFLTIVQSKNEFNLFDAFVFTSFTEKLFFDTAVVLLFLTLFQAIDKSGWVASIFTVFTALLAVANILLYYFGNTMLELHHFALITPYSVTSFVPMPALLAILTAVIILLTALQKVIKKMPRQHLFRIASFYLVVLIILTLLSTLNLFKKKSDERLDRVIMGFRNAQIYYACRNQFFSYIKDVVFPSLGERVKSLSPQAESFVNDYNLFSDTFIIESSINRQKEVINSWHIPLGIDNPPPLNLKPFTRIIYIFTESLSLEMLPCYNRQLQSQFATRFFCSKGVMSSTFQNFYTTGSPTLQGLTVTFNSHPNYNIQEPTGQLNAFPKLLEENGYTSIFMRSASKYFANENLILKNMGFSQIIGREDFYEDEELRKYIYGWGIEDRILYKQVKTLLKENRGKKIFIALLGTDTHPPHGQMKYKHLTYPQNRSLRNRASSPTFQWFQAIDRMDYDISLFLKELETEGLFDEETLIVISSDHSCPLNQVSSKIPGHTRNNLAKIPLIFLSKQQLPIVKNRVMASQVDVAPTLFHLLGIKREAGWWGDSLFNDTRKPFIIGFDKKFIQFSNGKIETTINSKHPENQKEKEFIELFNTIITE